MGEIRPKRCEGRELTKDQLGGSAAVQPPTAEGFTTLGNPLSVSEAAAAPAPRDHVQVQVRAGAGCGRWFLLWIVLMVGMWWNMHRRSTSADHDPLG